MGDGVTEKVRRLEGPTPPGCELAVILYEAVSPTGKCRTELREVAFRHHVCKPPICGLCGDVADGYGHTQPALLVRRMTPLGRAGIRKCAVPLLIDTDD